MGAYRELRKLPRGVSIADEFDERVEAARAAADSGDFALYISAQGGANVPRDCQTVRVARSPSDDVNEYEEEVERVVGIYAPHLGARHIHITRTTDWRIVPKVPVVEPLTLKSGIAAPRSPVRVLSITVESSPAVILRYRFPRLLSTPQQCLIWLMTVLSNGMTRRS